MYVSQDEYSERSEGNLFENVWKDLGVSIGSFAGSAVGKRIHDKLYKSGTKIIHEATSDLEDLASRPVLANQSRRQLLREAAKTKSAQGELTSAINRGYIRKAEAKSVGVFAKHMSHIGHMYNFAVMGQIGFSIGASLLKAGDSFRISKDQLEKQNYSELYDQDTYYDTRAAFTQRQRALQVIHNSRLSLKPMLGNESNYLHY